MMLHWTKCTKVTPAAGQDNDLNNDNYVTGSGARVSHCAPNPGADSAAGLLTLSNDGNLFLLLPASSEYLASCLRIC